MLQKPEHLLVLLIGICGSQTLTLPTTEDVLLESEWREANARVAVTSQCQVEDTAPSHDKVVRRRKRVVGGTPADESEHPWAVKILATYKGRDYLTCSGTLLRDGWVLTAAHCIHGGNARRMKFGVYNPATGARDYYGALVGLAHHGFNTTSLENDAAMVKLVLPRAVKQQLMPACVSPTEDIDRLPVTVSGWGRQDFDDRDSQSDVLKELRVIVYPNEDCIFQRTNYNFFNGDLMACAGQGRTVEGQDTCKGDSGAGLVAGGKAVVGIVSWGFGCGKHDRPTVIQRVAPLYGWIQNTMDSF